MRDRTLQTVSDRSVAMKWNDVAYTIPGKQDTRFSPPWKSVCNDFVVVSSKLERNIPRFWFKSIFSLRNCLPYPAYTFTDLLLITLALKYTMWLMC